MRERGISEDMLTMRETWSEEKRVREDRVDIEKRSSQARLKKALSRHSRVGVRQLSDLVNVSRSGSSMSCRSEMAVLNMLASQLWKFLLFFLQAKRIRLKSPIRSHGVEFVGAMSLSSCRKSAFNGRWDGHKC